MKKEYMEIERKFLVNNNIEIDNNLIESLSIFQFYISFNPEIRVRQQGLNYFLTIKDNGTLSRKEVEVEINEDDFYRLKNEYKCTYFIQKIRNIYKINNNNNNFLLAEKDIFDGKLKGLEIVEVEFKTLKEANDFIKPAWFGKEITEDKKYKNKNLAHYGLQNNK